MSELFTYGSVGGAGGNSDPYPEKWIEKEEKMGRESLIKACRFTNKCLH